MNLCKRVMTKMTPSSSGGDAREGQSARENPRGLILLSRLSDASARKAQRSALGYSAALASLNSVYFIPEPELAVRPYAQVNKGDGNLGPKLQGPQGFQHCIETEDLKRDLSLKHIQVADLGRGTFAVFILRNWMEEDKNHMLVAHGDERLDVNDVDVAFVDWIRKARILELAKQMQWQLPAADRQKLLLQACLAKGGPSSSETAQLSIDNLKVTLSRTNFWVVGGFFAAADAASGLSYLLGPVI